MADKRATFLISGTGEVTSDGVSRTVTAGMSAYLNSGATVEELDLPDPSPDGGERSRDLKDILARCVDRLAERQRTIFVMRHYDQLKNEDIAAALGISIGTVKSLHFKAIRNLRALMGPYMGWET